jgi:hypothetical protein
MNIFHKRSHVVISGLLAVFQYYQPEVSEDHA